MEGNAPFTFTRLCQRMGVGGHSLDACVFHPANAKNKEKPAAFRSAVGPLGQRRIRGSSRLGGIAHSHFARGRYRRTMVSRAT